MGILKSRFYGEFNFYGYGEKIRFFKFNKKKTRFCGFVENTQFCDFNKKNMMFAILVENFTILLENLILQFWQEKWFFSFNGKIQFSIFGGKNWFCVLAGNSIFLVFAKNSIFWFWREIKFYGFGEKNSNLASPLTKCSWWQKKSSKLWLKYTVYIRFTIINFASDFMKWRFHNWKYTIQLCF